ncbi:tetratricopeptide repeat protein [Ferruginibacter albus]|uniref:tetratricopeptide repeat protein n=1 Tax=Ferruginibacter albus TaxID=2875540 RepID=UPI001CC7D29E|nr:CDC27 family protein [Ferruginibacter albus]UAY52907.1 tetratricopeptide repeat protein [Ferruginibacter albus]
MNRLIRSASFLCLLFVIALLSCNNDDNNSTKTNSNKEEQLRKQIEQFPDSLLLRQTLIQYYRDANAYDKAIEEANKLIAKDSLNGYSWNIKATLYFENDDTLNAIHAFEKATQLSNNPEYLLSLASLYAKTKNIIAIAIADSLLHHPETGKQSEALFIKGLYYSYTGDKLKAIDYFDQCIALHYNDMPSYREKAICLYDLKKYNDALQVLKQAVTIDVGFDEAYYWMGRCDEKLDNKNDAIKNYQMALQLDKNFVEAQDALDSINSK